MPVVKILQQIYKQEKQAKAKQKIRYLLHDDKSEPIKHIDVPHLNLWRTITNPKEVKDCLLQHNHNHFSQAIGTPFTMPPISDLLDPSAHNALDDSMLQTLINNPTISPEVCSILQFLVDSTSPQMPIKFMESDIRSAYKAWKQNTSTLLSGQYLEHYYTLLPVDDEQSHKFCNLHTTIMNATFLTNTVPDRWLKVAMLMIQKKPKSIRINELWVIHILKADCNLFLKLAITRTLMPELEKRNWLSDHQCGSQRACSAINAAFFQTQYHKHLTLTQQNGIAFNMDASACYDCLLSNL